MQPPIDIPLPRQPSSFHSLDSSVFVGSPDPDPFGLQVETPIESTEDFDSTIPVSASRNAFRSLRHATTYHTLPSGSQPNQRRPEYTRQWSLFGQLMENEGQLPSSISSTSRRSRLESDGDMSVREHLAGLYPRTRPSASFHTQDSAEPINDDTPFPIHPITSDLPSNHGPDSLSSSTATFEVPSRTIQSYLPFRLPAFTITHRNVLKCAIAYFVASLFTYSPHLSRFISDLSTHGLNDRTTPSPSGHMVATM